MMTGDLFEALEICMAALEQGSNVESCLEQFPALAEDLRPILETAILARGASEIDIPSSSLRRSKLRVLKAAAEMRDKVVASPRRPLLGGFLRFAVTAFMLFVFFLLSGTGLVLAAEDQLPGDGLYPVKRGWETLQLWAVRDPQLRAELETVLLQERRREVGSLLQLRRSAPIYFQGIVEAQEPAFWTVAGLKVVLADQVQIEGNIIPGAQVAVWGNTQNGSVIAERIQLLLISNIDQTPKTLPFPTATVSPTTIIELMTPTPAIPQVSTQTATPINPTPTRTRQPVGNENDNSNDDNSNENNGDNSNNNNNNDDNANEIDNTPEDDSDDNENNDND